MQKKLVKCLKQTTRCVIWREDGTTHESTNLCVVDGLKECPRVLAKCETGEGYELCGSVHAEALAAEKAKATSHLEGEAWLYGHTWICKNCQDALIAVNVRTFHIYHPEGE